MITLPGSGKIPSNYINCLIELKKQNNIIRKEWGLGGVIGG